MFRRKEERLCEVGQGFVGRQARLLEGAAGAVGSMKMQSVSAEEVDGLNLP